ncbi:unnamed protein product [Ophioblennius macclurei]
MRPTASTMLQQNNNNNYPCLNVSGSTREMLQKCSRASLPFPSRLELGLGDLPLIRGLRAWALCSKNRRKAGSLLGGGGGGGGGGRGGQAPVAPPLGRGASNSCPRPADVYLNEEWGRMGYGLPLGLDARQVGIGALVTVATLKTSEGSGKTQTQCLFLRTEKGNCLYSTAKPRSGVVGGWLRGKTGAGGGGAGPGGGKDNGLSPPAQTGANWVRVRSGRRWRKSAHPTSREKAGASRERRQRSRDHPAGESTVEERQEERDKEGPDGKAFSSPQQDGRRSRCCHNTSLKSCSQCGRRTQGKEARDEHDRGESPRRGTSNELDGDWKGMRNEDEEDEKWEGVLCKPQSYCSAEVVSRADLQSDCTDKDSHMEESQGEAQSNKELQTSQKKNCYSDENEDTNPDGLMLPIMNGDLIHGRSRLVTDDSKSEPNDRAGDERCEDMAANVNGFSDYAKAPLEVVKEALSKENDREIQDPAESSVSHHLESFSMFTSDCDSANESSAPTEGSTHPESCWGQKDHESRQNHLEGHQQEEGVHKSECQEELSTTDNTVKRELNGNKKLQFVCKNEEISDHLVEGDGLSSPVRHKESSVSETDNGIEAEKSSSCGMRESEPSDELENTEGRLNPEQGGITSKLWRRESTCKTLNDGENNAEQGNDCKGAKRDGAVGEEWRVEESEDAEEEDDGDTCGPTSIALVEANGETSTNVSVDPATLSSLPLDNPAPSLPPLEFMAIGLDCLEAEKEQEEEEIQATVGDKEGGQEGRRRELEKKGSTVATVEEKKEEEEEEEEDEFGVFMQAEGEPDWSEGFTTSASVPCGSRESLALGDEAVSEESSHWTAGWTDSSFHQSEDSWTAFPHDSSDDCGDAVEQWWPSSAVEERRDRLSTNHNLAAIFAKAFPSLPALSSSDSCDLNTVPTLTQVLRGRASRDQGLLDNFHDLNKMIGQRYKRASGVSRDLLLRTLHLEQPHVESRPAVWTARRRLSPGLPSANQHAQNAATKRRLSYDYNRNVME